MGVKKMMKSLMASRKPKLELPKNKIIPKKKSKVKAKGKKK